MRVPSRLAEAAAQQLPQADADAELGSCQTVELRLAPIAQDQALLGIEHRQPLGHVVERGIKLRFCAASLRSCSVSLTLEADSSSHCLWNKLPSLWP